jgi:hypothetical protein
VARNSPGTGRKFFVVLIGLSAAILSHMLHNGALVLASSSDGGTLLLALLNYGVMVILLIGLRIIAVRNERTVLQTYLRDEVPAVLSSEAYAALIDRKRNGLAALHLPPYEQRTFVQAAAELAQKKRQLIRMGNEGAAGAGNSAEIERLRVQLTTFGERVTR